MATDTDIQLSPDNLVSSETEHRISDGQKRFKTLGKTTSSKYPRPKTLFYVSFENNKIIDSNLSKELSNYVLSIDKPTITYTTKKMNQYNRIKYVYGDIKYGPLKITFIDVKDNPIQQAFFQYLRHNNNDIVTDDEKYKTYSDYKYEDSNWGLNINSNDKMFTSITIYEMFLDRLMVYKVENPVLNQINFGSNKLGDFAYNEITVTFDVEGITNILDKKIIDDSSEESINVIGEQIARIGGANLAHYLGMRWFEGSGATGEQTDITLYGTYTYWNNNIINKNETNQKIQNARNKLQLEQAERSATQYLNSTNKTKYYWIPDGIGNVGRAISVEDIGKLASPRNRQLTDYFGF